MEAARALACRPPGEKVFGGTPKTTGETPVPPCERTRKIMALKFKFKSKDEIPAEHLPLYAERDGAWHLDVDGAVEKSKLDEFRNNNVALIKERDELKKRFEGIDPEEIRRLVEEKQKLELQAQGHKPEEIEKIVEGRVKSLKSEWEKQVAGLTSERDGLTARLTTIQIDQGVTTVATKRGLRPTAIPDITRSE